MSSHVEPNFPFSDRLENQWDARAIVCEVYNKLCVAGDDTPVVICRQGQCSYQPRVVVEHNPIEHHNLIRYCMVLAIGTTSP